MIPFGPGGGSDITSRVISSVAKKYCPQPIVLLNRPGASGTRCIYDLTRSKPDGYRMAFSSNSEGCSALHLLPVKYTLDSYKVICSIDNRSPVVVTKGPWKTLKELIDYSKQNPGKVRAGVPGLGTVARLTGEWLAMEAGVKWKIVPFHGSGPVIPALLGGHVEIAFLWPNVVMGLYKSGDLKILTLMGDRRSEVFPKVPIAKEDGFHVKGASTHFIIVPNGVPKPIREKLYVLMEQVTQDPEFVNRLAALGTDVLFMDSETSTDFLKDWYKTSKKLYEMLGMIKKK